MGVTLYHSLMILLSDLELTGIASPQLVVCLTSMSDFFSPMLTTLAGDWSPISQYRVRYQHFHDFHFTEYHVTDL